MMLLKLDQQLQCAYQLSWHLQREKFCLPCTVFNQSQVSKLNVVVVYGGKTRLDEAPQRPEQMSCLDSQHSIHSIIVL